MRIQVWVLLSISAIAPGLSAFQLSEPVVQLRQAEKLLIGEHKDTLNAGKVLQGIVGRGDAVDPITLTYAYVYLGYIDDQSGDREHAIEWFHRALSVEGGPRGARGLAMAGLTQPISIRMFDERAAPQVVERPAAGAAYLTKQAPGNMPPLAKNLSDRERRENFAALWSLIDTTYAHFELKDIDWQAVWRRYWKQLDSIQTDSQFYFLMSQLANEMKDAHAHPQNYRLPLQGDAPGIAIDLFQGKPFVIGGNADIAPGWEVVMVDGLAIPEKMEAMRPYLWTSSSDRAFRRDAARHLLVGFPNTMANVTLRAPDGAIHTVRLARQMGVHNRLPKRKSGVELTRLRFLRYGRLPSGIGYIQMPAFNGHSEIAEDFDAALAELHDAPALILDIRDNTGGFGQPRIVGRLLTERKLAVISYSKNGPGHGELRRRERYLSPAGEWQYTRPVALLVNEMTGSAADLFACQLRSAGRVVTVGTTTHGDLPGDEQFAVLPCGLVVRISSGYICDAHDRPIEVNGNVPDVMVEPTVEDFLAGRDPVLERAVGLLLKSGR